MNYKHIMQCMWQLFGSIFDGFQCRRCGDRQRKEGDFAFSSFGENFLYNLIFDIFGRHANQVERYLRVNPIVIFGQWVSRVGLDSCPTDLSQISRSIAQVFCVWYWIWYGKQLLCIGSGKEKGVWGNTVYTSSHDQM